MSGNTAGLAEMIQDAGLPEGIDYIVEKTGQSRQTIRNWALKKPDLLAVVILGCRTLYGQELAKKKRTNLGTNKKV